MKLLNKKILWFYGIGIAFLLTFTGSCKKDNFTEIPGICPVVKSTDPVNLATGVPAAKVISITFNEKMNPATLTHGSFILRGAARIPGTLDYTASTATWRFTPTNPLSDNTTYTGRVTTAVKDLMGNALQQDYVWSFSTGAVIAPAVIATDPVDNASGVPLNKTITASFNMPMDPLTINTATFRLRKGAIPVNGTVTYTDSTASFTPSGPLSSDTVYTASITIGAKNMGGVPLGADYTWTFQSGSQMAPIVVASNPVNRSTGIPVSQLITARFNMPMDPLTLNTGTFLLKLGNTPISGTVTYTDSTATFTPAAQLLTGNTYTATITTGAKNVAGVAVANSYIWTFTTISIAPVVLSTDPANLATGVVLNKTVKATFSTPMDPLTLNTSTFTLRLGAALIAGTVSYGATTASFTPSANLVPGNLYTATITTGAKSVFGTALVSNYVWTFTTGAAVAPTVILTSPLNNATGVPLNKVLTATFSVPMDPLTITSTTFTLFRGLSPVTGLVSYSGSTASFTPDVNLLPGNIYTATITTGAKNVSGTALVSNYVWTFTTVSAIAPIVISTDPANNATGVAANKVVTATFSTPMNPLTITSSTFTLKQGATAVSGAVTYSGSTASFTPAANLSTGSIYTATITTGATDVGGTALAANYVWTFTMVPPAGPAGVDLKTVARFGIIAGTGVSNNAGFSVINNQDVGISPGVRSSITGFPPATIVGGAMYASDDVAPPGVAAMLTLAKQDLTDAYLFAEAASAPAPITVSGDLGGTTLAPGIYKSTSTLLIQSGNLTLDAQGDPNAVWIFQVASAFTTVGGAGGSVILTGGAQAKNIFWQTGSSATIGDFTSFNGTILALTSITMNSGATATGRMLARNGAVVMTSTNTIYKP